MNRGDVVADRFELVDRVGEGGMGVVFRAVDRQTQNPVALKMMLGGADKERFFREAALLARLSHAAIVGYIAHGSSEGTLWVAMEWLEGEDLADRLERKPLSLEESVIIVRRIAEALAVVHAQGVVHRDVKPSNILLPNGRAEASKLLDFGIARTKLTRALTKPGATLGTPGYMAPEQARGEPDVGPAADVFSLGCVLFECIAHEPVFSGAHFVAILAKVLIETAPRLADVVSGVPEELDDLVARMLAKNPAERPPNGGVVAAELTALLEKLTRGGDATLLAANRSSITPLSVVEVAIVSIVLVDSGDPNDVELLREAAAPFGGMTLMVLADGSLLGVANARGLARDQAAQAARFALSLHDVAPNRACALATGRANASGVLPVGEAIDRASSLVRLGGPGVRIDEATAALLEGRFEIEGASLRRERELAADVRIVLGKHVPCVGREAELGTLQGLFQQCIDDPIARAVLVSAPSGAGKSRLVHELVRRIRAQGTPFQLWTGRGDPMRAGSPLGILSDALRRAMGLSANDSIADRQRKIAERVARNVRDDAERVTWFLAEMIGCSFPENIPLAAARRDPQLMADQLRAAFEDFVLAETAALPTILALDDLHWGDAATVSFVDSALRVASGRPLLIVATARPDVRDQFPRLWAERDLHELSLGELTTKAAEKLVRFALPDLAAATVARIVERAAGSALYLEELLRAEADGRGDETPKSVLAMVGSRLDALPADMRRVLRAASTFGRAFHRDGVSALVGVSDPVLDALLLAMIGRELIVRPEDTSPHEYVFRHDVVREAAYAMLTDTDSVLAHRHAGAWLERSGEEDAFVLAEHFEKGGEPERAAKAYLRAARQAFAASSLDAAHARAGQGLRCGAAGELRGELHGAQAEVEILRGTSEGARLLADLALPDLAQGGEPRQQLLGLLVVALSRMGNVERAEALGRELLSTHAPGARLRAATSLLLVGSFDLAAALADTKSEDPEARFRHHAYEAFRNLTEGSIEAALHSFEGAATLAEEAKSVRRECQARANLGFALGELGAYERAEQELTLAMKRAERIGLSHTRAGIRQNLGMARARQGAIAEGIALERQAVEEFERLADRRMQGGAITYLAILLAEAGDLQGAQEQARTAADLLLAAAPPLRPAALAILARALLLQGRINDALPHASEALAFLEGGGRVDEGDARVRLVAAEVLGASGDHERARKVIRNAHALLLERAEKVNDPILRTSFLERIPEHARTVALASAKAVGVP